MSWPENRLRIALGTLLGAPEISPAAILGHFRGDLGCQGGPRRLPEASQARPGPLPEAAQGDPGDARGGFGASRGRLRNVQATLARRAGAEKAARVCCCTRDLLEMYAQSGFSMIFARFSVGAREARPLRSIAPVSKNRGSTMRTASRVARATQPRKTLKIDPEIDPKS